ncbi:DUF3098 domain-containing protein [Parafilimonas sp.]|jgi:hypothetical protein|uniref:DUF3098 domain-containing protein n=1 Tax=Parafilimonas sp. TaxID=1969739 RepID=UPI003F7FE221
MAELKKQTSPQPQQVKTAKATDAPALFNKENYKWMLIGGIIIILGMVLLSGGKNTDPNTFDYKVVYSTTRVTIAPILIVLGLLVEIYAIFRKPVQPANA